MTAPEPVDRPWETPADETPADETPADETPADETPADETPADETPAAPSDAPSDAGAYAVVLLAAFGVVPPVAGVLSAAGFLVQRHTTTTFWTTVVFFAGVLALAAGGKAAQVGYMVLREALAHWSSWVTVPSALVAFGLALTSGVESFLAIYSGATPWVWLVAAGPVAAGAVAAVAIAAAPGE